MRSAKLTGILIALALAVPAAATAAAADTDFYYDGEVSIFTEEPIYDPETTEKPSLKITDECYYDTNSKMFRFSVPENPEYIYSNVADGMITTSVVTLKVDSGVAAKLYRNGDLVEKTDLMNITTIGDYSVVVSSGADVDYQLFTFSIASKTTGLYSVYKMPEGFELTGVTCSSEVQPIWNKNAVELTEDGDYSISYKCKATGIEYGLKVNIDHTPPTVELKGVKDGVAKKAVQVSGISKGDKLYITLDGNETNLTYENELKMPGTYVLKVTDPAGNTVTENFRIRMYLNAQAVWFTAIIVGLIIAAGTYMYVVRKKLRVR